MCIAKKVVRPTMNCYLLIYDICQVIAPGLSCHQFSRPLLPLVNTELRVITVLVQVCHIFGHYCRLLFDG